MIFKLTIILGIITILMVAFHHFYKWMINKPIKIAVRKGIILIVAFSIGLTAYLNLPNRSPTTTSHWFFTTATLFSLFHSIADGIERKDEFDRYNRRAYTRFKLLKRNIIRVFK